ncbi:uncharacterized protein A4U43_C03F6200 [Asparagus officinalis]|uniref:Uncharacterized protein n=1 Tax=Asparagus officinalis TaxID=4686 RepID=A0A5P1FAJ7_ASPOF|nr:uncharacterized protein A4U43_C03F6200 [Asparagus officinalis]
MRRRRAEEAPRRRLPRVKAATAEADAGGGGSEGSFVLGGGQFWEFWDAGLRWGGAAGGRYARLWRRPGERGFYTALGVPLAMIILDISVSPRLFYEMTDVIFKSKESIDLHLILTCRNMEHVEAFVMEQPLKLWAPESLAISQMMDSKLKSLVF